MLAMLVATPTNPLLITPVGVVIALLFAAAIIGVLGWMLHLPPETELSRTTSRAVRSLNKMTRILVPLLHCSEETDRALALALQMARHRNGSVWALAVIEVPFMLPLDATLGEEEKRVQALIERARSVARQSQTPSTLTVRVLKARQAGPAIVYEATQSAADLIIVANCPVRVRGSLQQIDPAVEYVLKHAPCEVLVLSGARVSPSREQEPAPPTAQHTSGVESQRGSPTHEASQELSGTSR
ncbi:MAG: universal stress protein [Thermogemmatispora sp.]|uniref:universal stress protein n=1 Tax=Thermogemmatispora sp. TaxID=1968838 RepID=UPI0019DA702D|nr:universal stress protein [Thermogemmatispora sp.]MBE3564312.1 universal stress protein [Thermogemmatispora sp.]